MKHPRLMCAICGMAFFLCLTLLGPAPTFASENVSTFIYLPFITRLPTTDLTITGLEVTQSTQTANNSVPLVAHKPTVVRVFATTQIGAPTNSVIWLNANRNGADLGTITVAAGTIPSTNSRGDYASTFNALIPLEWASGTVNLTAWVDPEHLIPESNEANNQVTFAAVFHEVPTLQLMLVPIDYTHQGSSHPGFYPGQAVDHVSNWMARVYPVGSTAVTFHAPYAFAGDLQSGSSWSTLLGQIADLRTTDGQPSNSIVYQGMVPIKTGSTQWFSSGIAGIGYIGYRASVALDLGASDTTGSVSGHEVGHNFGRTHTPCGSPANPDPQYPYAGASIGEYGLDINGTNTTFKTPENTVDFMSYCRPQWTSDYTYNALYQDQLQNPLNVDDFGPSLFIRAEVDLNGEVALRPLYLFPAYRSNDPADSPYQVQLLNAKGEIIATHSLPVYQAQEENVMAQRIAGVVPLPNETVTAVRLLENGVVVSQEALLSARELATESVQLSQTADNVTLQWADSAPAIVRYTVDNGRSWTTYAIDTGGSSDTASLTIPSANLPGGQGTFQVILANHPTPLTVDLTEPLPTPPAQVWITGPTATTGNGLDLVYYANVSGLDTSDAPVFTWHIDGHFIANGAVLLLKGVDPGPHHLTLTVEDASGHTSQGDYDFVITNP